MNARRRIVLALAALDLPELGGKLLQLLREARPGLTRIGIVWEAAIGRAQFEATERAARDASIRVRPAPIRTAADAWWSATSTLRAAPSTPPSATP
jgi:hypothetical protein